MMFALFSLLSAAAGGSPFEIARWEDGTTSTTQVKSWRELKRWAESKVAMTIRLSPSFDSGDYDSPATITASITIDGNGAVLDASKGASTTTRRFFLMEADDAALSLRSLTLANGFVSFSTYGGGAIYSSQGRINITGCKFVGNTAYGGFGGGAICTGGPLFVTNSSFTGNTAGASGGGAIYAAGGGTVISSSNFVGNEAGYNAGAVYIVASAVTLADSNFANNTAQKGGAIGLFMPPWNDTATSVAALHNVILRENVASYQGGALFCGGGNELVLNKSTLASNSATDAGEAIFVESGGKASVHCSLLNRSRVVGDVSFSNACLPSDWV